MFRIEKIGDKMVYVKATGTFPVEEANKFVNDFEEYTKDFPKFSVLIDLLDATFLNVKSFNILLELFKRNNEKLIKSSFVICCNPPLSAEFQLLIERAASPNRKMVNNLDDAKEWLGIESIILKK